MPVLQEQKPVIAARCWTGVFSSSSSKASGLAPFPRFAGVTEARSRLLGAKTPWNRVYAHIGTMRRSYRVRFQLEFRNLLY